MLTHRTTMEVDVTRKKEHARKSWWDGVKEDENIFTCPDKHRFGK